MKLPILLTRVSLLGLAIGCLAFSPPLGSSSRGIACVDPVVNTLAFPEQLFGQIQDQALRKSTLDFYLMLSQAETNALVGRQSIRAMYGLSDSPMASGTLYAPPAIVNFNAASNPFGATGFLWGNLNSLGNASAPAASLNSGNLTIGNGILAAQPSLGSNLFSPPANSIGIQTFQAPNALPTKNSLAPTSLTKPGISSKWNEAKVSIGPVFP